MALTAASLTLSGCSGGGKKTVNQPCLASSDCADDICHRGICASSSPADNGGACNGAGDCKSYNCNGSICVTGTRGKGEACRKDQECGSKSCNNGSCGPAAKLDGGAGDGAPDTGPPDLTAQDAALPEAAAPDQGPPDISLQDAPSADQGQIDASSSDTVLHSTYMKWAKVSSFPAKLQVSAISADDKLLLVGGGTSSTAGSIQRSDDGGKTWKQVHSGTHSGSRIVSISMDGLAGSAADMGGKIYSTSDGGKKWSTSRHDCWTGEVYGAVTHLGTITIAVGLGNICRAATLTGTFTDTAKKDGTSPITLTGVSLVKVSGKPEAITVGWRKLGATSWKHYVYYSVDQGKTWSDSSYLFSKTTQYIPEDVLLLPSGRAVGVGQKGFFHDFDPGKSSTTHTPLGSSSDKLFALARVQPSGGGNAHILVSGNASYFSDKDGTTFTTLKGKEVVPSLNAAAFNGKGKAYLGLSVSPGGLITSTW